ncbi:uncharacterized protein N0V89_010394 [Didymosphaeria variabile]|uniref:Uncharacterized protein n=1 Tax=Didymosphaeria variabile TaxID=1932322 RepID=A0A9W8XBJ6_9PLEO|nr:uncharacterized protein N0V89_010394 [Didymosphaeria variabile]KAJ4346465.1 hypothetical protein N0V89_010394 [Didymosphaeria variabile]
MSPPKSVGFVPRESTASTDPCVLQGDPGLNASVSLQLWTECQVTRLFPIPSNGAWDKAFADTFCPSLLATFNNTHYDYSGWLNLYKSFNATIGKTFAHFEHGLTSTLAVPDANGIGGLAYLIGWEGGYHNYLKKDLWFSDAAFARVATVNGERQIVEFRESSNIPNTAPLPEPREWTCAFKD